MIRILFKQALDEKSFKEGRRITLNEVSEETGISRPTLTRISNVPGYNTKLTFIEEEVKRLRAEKAEEQGDASKTLSVEEIQHAVRDGTSQRVRPVVMTATSTIVGLLPIMFISGTGADVMQRIAAPMIGGMLTTTVLTLLVLPAIYSLVVQHSEKTRS